MPSVRHPASLDQQPVCSCLVQPWKALQGMPGGALQAHESRGSGRTGSPATGPFCTMAAF